MEDSPVLRILMFGFEDGTVVGLNNLERPQLLLDRKGNPEVFYGAFSITPLVGKRDGSTYNVQVKINR